VLDTTHLIAFLAGTAAGAAGTYMADRFTDQRRKQELRRETKDGFDRLRQQMPDLLDEMCRDLTQSKDIIYRELVALPTERTTFNHDGPRLEYYETKHPNLNIQIAILVESGYLRNVSITNWPIYRMSEKFVELVTREG
jgi:hypothetical protein